MTSSPPGNVVIATRSPQPAPGPASGSGVAARRILVVEDQFLIASDIIAAFEEGGFGVAGPVSTLEGAMALLDEGHDLAGAVVDLRLQGDLAYPLVDKLLERRIPTVLSTGYDWSAIPERYGSLPRFEKPVDPFALVEVFREGNS